MEQLRLVRAPAASFSLASGSSGNSIYVSGSSSSVLVDVGINCKGIVNALDSKGIDPSELSGILITHEHSDHVKGLDVFSKRFRIPIYMNEATWRAVRPTLKYADLMDIRLIETGSSFIVGDIEVSSFKTPHDAVESMGFRLNTGKCTVSVFTDLGCVDEALLDHVRGSELIYIEANYDTEMLAQGPYPWYLKERIRSGQGHLSNVESSKAILALLEGGTKEFILSHLSQSNNYPELAELTVTRQLNLAGARVGQDLKLRVAPRFEPGDWIDL